MGARLQDASERTPEMLIVRTVPVADPGDLVARLPHPAALAWIRHGEGLVGWGVAACVTVPAGEDRFAAAEKWLRELFETAQIADEVRAPGTGPVAFGSFTFDPASDGSVLIVPRAVLGRAAGRAWLTTITDGCPPDATAVPVSSPAELASSPAELASSPAELASSPAELVTAPAMPVTAPAGVRWSDGSLTAPRWEQAVCSAVARIRAGALRKVVLARDLNAVAPQDIDARVLLARLAARYPGCYTFCCAGLVGATPELLIRRDGDRVRSLVLAGTTPRGGTPAADKALGATLLASAKNIEEHGYAVDDVRAALLPFCDELEVERQPSLLRLANVQHLATRVSGRLAAARPGGARPGGARPGGAPSALALAAALHPTAAVCGTPADAAMELIRDLEGMDRGRYAGPVGWVDSRGNGAWGIALRCAQLDGRRARLYAGCGIVADSDPAAELTEAQAKFRPIQDALEG